ncbi:MAG: putative manganese-dependent inorganic diphosphatase [Clostridiales bacterium]|nr:putative manganese-dependent inorganic diphosphatase [Clostridiales bacterium]
MIYIFGHKSPDTDSICSAVALSRLKNKMGIETEACALGPINKESEYALNRFEVEHPRIIDDIKTEVKDLVYDEINLVDSNSSVLQAFEMMEYNKVKTLPVGGENGRLMGIVTMKDIAMGLIQNDERRLKTHMNNIIHDLNGKMLIGQPTEVDGQVMVMAFFHKTVKKNIILDKNWISIVGDNYDNIEHCIKVGVQLIIITGNHVIPKNLLNRAKEKNVPIMSVSLDTYLTSRKINQCTYLSSIMRSDEISAFKEYEYLEDVYKKIREHRHAYYPVIDQNNKYLGFIGRNQLLNPQRKKVIMVDHNEYSQSALGIEEAEILEVVDHHKIGSIRTTMPISFRNMPVGSTCTIVYQMYRESGYHPEKDVAGLLLSGIISDTLNFKSPTTTNIDKEVTQKLNEILELDIDGFAKEMFKVGTSLEGLTTEEVFYRDFKTFDVENGKLGVSQVFTLDIENVMNRSEEIIGFIKNEHKTHGYIATLLVITDIINEGSTLIYQTEIDGLFTKSFGIKEKQGMFVPKLISRKKQVVPGIMETLNRIEI